MNTETKALLIVGLVTIALLIGGVFFLSSKAPKTSQTDQGVVYQIDYSKAEKIGTDSAKVKLAEFGDFRCPACALFEQTVEQIRNNPNVQFFFFNFAFLGPASTTAANAALCSSEQGKYWEYHDWLYKNQPPETDTSMYTTDKLTSAATSLGMNGDQFKACLSASKYQQKVSDGLSLGQTLGVNSTPTFFLNGQKMVTTSPNDLVNSVNQAAQKP